MERGPLGWVSRIDIGTCLDKSQRDLDLFPQDGLMERGQFRMLPLAGAFRMSF